MNKLIMMIGAAAVAVGTALDSVATELITNGSFETYTGTIGNSGKYDAFSASFTIFAPSGRLSNKLTIVSDSKQVVPRLFFTECVNKLLSKSPTNIS